MKTITIRGIDEKIDKAIKMLAKKEQKSINQWLLGLLKKTTGIDKEKIFQTYDDLDELAGTWSKDDGKLFNNNTRQFNKIDKDLWK